MSSGRHYRFRSAVGGAGRHREAVCVCLCGVCGGWGG